MTGTRCAVACCTNGFKGVKRKGLDISFHRFPKDEHLRKLWTEKTYRKDFDARANVICSEHFTKEDYESDLQFELTGNPKKRRLLKTAVPSVNLRPEDWVVTVKKERTETKKEVVNDSIDSSPSDNSRIKNNTSENSKVIVNHIPRSGEDLFEDKYKKLLINHYSLRRKYRHALLKNRKLERKSEHLKLEAQSLLQKLKVEKDISLSLQKILNRLSNSG